MSKYWIGIDDKSIEGNFVYASDGKPIVWTNWSPVEPNSWQGKNEDCVARDWGLSDTWSDVPCETNYPVICERN